MATEARLVIFADVAYRPLSQWAELWAIPETTIRGWIQQGLCPGKKIGRQWMISQMELLNWEPPKEEDGKVEGRGLVRNEEKRSKGPARAEAGRQPNSWPV